MKKLFIIVSLFNIIIFNCKAAQANLHTYPSSISQLNSYNDLDEFLNNMEPETLVLFDIDETLIDAAHMICKSKFRKEREIFYQTYLKNIMVNNYFNKFYDQKCLTEPKIKELIESLQKKGILVLGFTARYTNRPDLGYTDESTYNVLLELGIDFKNNYNMENFDIPDIENLGAKPKFYNGIIFTESRPKGQTLYSFLSYSKLRPKNIVFFDDKYKNLISVKEVIDIVNANNQKKGNPGFKFHGYHYTYVKSISWILDEKIVQIQGEYALKHQQWLSDEMAKKILQESKINH